MINSLTYIFPVPNISLMFVLFPHFTSCPSQFPRYYNHALFFPKFRNPTNTFFWFSNYIVKRYFTLIHQWSIYFKIFLTPSYVWLPSIKRKLTFLPLRISLTFSKVFYHGSRLLSGVILGLVILMLCIKGFSALNTLRQISHHVNQC